MREMAAQRLQNARFGRRALPATDEDIEVVGEASNGCEAAELPASFIRML
jgi:hypothetical protein